MDKRYIFLKSPIGSGGEANIYTVQINSELVAKVYHQPHGDYARKLAFMVANPPVDPLAKEGRVSIAWATELVTDLGLVVGFLMPKLDTSKAKPIFQYYNPSERRKESPTFSYVSLLRTARNLARAVRSVHSRGYVIGDVNESNVLVAEDAIVTLVDTDSFQVNDGTTVYRCTVGKPEYTPPELQGVSFRDVDRSVEHDLFGLGVLIYQLLMEGTHPFGGVFRGQGEAPELKERIKAGHFPHGRRGVPYNPMPLAPSFQMLPVALQELFLLCFEQGHGNPAARPTADVWSKALGEAEDGLVRCGVNGQHYYSGHLGVCPWCERAAKLGGRDPFPALGGISSGQHLKPAAIGKSTSKKSPIKITTPKLKPKTTPTKSTKSTSTYTPKTNLQKTLLFSRNLMSLPATASSNSILPVTTPSVKSIQPSHTNQTQPIPTMKNILGSVVKNMVYLILVIVISPIFLPVLVSIYMTSNQNTSRNTTSSITKAKSTNDLPTPQKTQGATNDPPMLSMSPSPSPKTTSLSEKYPSPSPTEKNPLTSEVTSPYTISGEYRVVLDPKVLADAEKEGVKSVTGKWTIKPEGTFKATLKAVSVKGEEQEIETAGKITIEDGKVVSQVETVNGEVPPQSPPKQPYTLSSDGKELQADGQPVKLIRTAP